MRTTPFFSIIVPVYNAEAFIDKCIGCVMSQNFTDYELILVNDGSKDNSYEICTDYAKKDKRIICVDKKNGGPGSARNAGIEASNGKYIAFLDSDDIVSKFWLQAYYDAITRFNSDICYQDLNYFSKEEDIEAKPYNGNDCNIIGFEDFGEFFTNKWVLLSATCTKCVKAELVKNNKIEFNRNISICEDFLFTCNILNVASSISITNHCGYYYRIVQGSLSRHRISHEKFIVTFKNITEDKVWDNDTKLNRILKNFYGSYSVYPLLDYEIYKQLEKEEKHRIYSYFRTHGIRSNRKKSLPLKLMCKIKACNALFNLYFNTISRIVKS